ncbi:hypothetical protein ACLK19_22675 [Escherichia coli]
MVKGSSVPREQNASVPMPQLEQANQALVAKTGALQSAPHSHRHSAGIPD